MRACQCNKTSEKGGKIYLKMEIKVLRAVTASQFINENGGFMPSFFSIKPEHPILTEQVCPARV